MCCRTVLSAVAFVIVVAAPAGAKSLYVGTMTPSVQGRDTFEPGQTFPTLGEAVAAAADGDTIFVLQAELAGDVRLDKRVKVTGITGAARPTFRGTLTATADGIHVDRLAFTGTRRQALVVEGVAKVRVSNCLFTDLLGGVLLRGATSCVVEDCQFLYAGIAVQAAGGGGHRIVHNTIDSCGWQAIHVADSSGNEIADNFLARCSWSGVLLTRGSNDNRIRGNALSGGQVGISVSSRDNVVADNTVAAAWHGILLGPSPEAQAPADDVDRAITGNVVEGNLLRDCRREGILVVQARSNLVRGNRMTGCGRAGIVLLDGADDNVLEDNAIPNEPAVIVIGSTGNGLGGASEAAAVPAPGPASFPADGDSGLFIAFGDVHLHTTLSDGALPPEDVLTYARDVAGLDFTGLSDHAESLTIAAEPWRRMNDAVEAHHAPGRFVTFPGYETTFDLSWEGHYNTTFAGPAPDAPVLPVFDASMLMPNVEIATPFLLLEALRGVTPDHVTIRHHYMETPDYWSQSPEDPGQLVASEVSSVHGVWSGDRDVDSYRSGRAAEHAGHASTMLGGLRLGRVFGVTGSSDSHYGFAGDYGLMGVLVDELTREAVIAAIRGRRTYGTTGARILLSFTADGEPMGSILRGAGEAAAAPPVLRAATLGTAPLEEFALFENDRIVHRAEADPDDPRRAALEFTPAAPPPDGTWYQVRVRQQDGEVAWSTPIWIAPQPPALADAETLLLKRRMAALLQAEYLRRWPHVPSPALGGKSPFDAAADPALREKLVAAFAHYEKECLAFERLALEIGLTREEAAAAHARFGTQFRRAPESLVDPTLRLEQVRARLGLAPDGK